MTPREFQLLLYCARSQPDAESIKNLIGRGVNWQALVELAQQHYVRPLLLQSLKSVCWDAVPKTTKLTLERFNRANLQKNLIFARELLRLSELFQQNRIPIVTFKGPVLAVSVYGDLGLREFSDLDLLVHESDLRKTESILTACGYRADFPDQDYRLAFVSYQGQYAFRDSETRNLNRSPLAAIRQGHGIPDPVNRDLAQIRASDNRRPNCANPGTG